MQTTGGTRGSAVRLVPPDAEARVFLRMRAAIAWHTLRSMLSSARLRLALVVVLSGMFWASLFGLFVEAFRFLDALHAEVIPLLFNAFYSSLMVMLVFSTGILLYGGLFCSTEARLLLTLPGGDDLRPQVPGGALVLLLGLRAPGQPDARGLRRGPRVGLGLFRHDPAVHDFVRRDPRGPRRNLLPIAGRLDAAAADARGVAGGDGRLPGDALAGLVAP
jgi:hypothetical protein